jgi:hypothetical protein
MWVFRLVFMALGIKVLIGLLNSFKKAVSDKLGGVGNPKDNDRQAGTGEGKS